MTPLVAKKIRNCTSNGSNHILVQRIITRLGIERPLKKQENERREDADRDEVVDGVHPPKLFLKNQRRNARAPVGGKSTRILLAALVLLGAGAAFWLLSDRFEAVPEGQVIAIVDNYEITTTDLATEARMLGVSIESETSRRAVLESLINRQLLVSKAAAQGLDRSPQFQAERRRSEQMLLARLALEAEAQSVQQPTAQAVQRFIADHPGFFNERHKITLDQIRFRPATGLPRQEITTIDSIEEGERRLRARGINYERGTVTLDSATLQPEAAGRIQRIPTGDIFHLNEGGMGVLSKVLAREHLSVSDSERQVIAARLLAEQAASDALRTSVRTQREKANIRYQEGFAPATPRGTNR
jgi:peptidyl-prolyl cis-trans isomerase C